MTEEKEHTMNKDLTELVFIVDRSGSMGGLESDTIGGINATLAKNRALEGDANVSIVLFDTTVDVIVDRKPIAEVADLTAKDYQVRGCTALLDAVGDSIKHIKRVQGYMPDEYKAGRVIFVITTDGLENASSRYSYADVKKAIEARTEEGWEFIFLAANIDAVVTAEAYGIDSSRAVNYHADEAGTHEVYASVSHAMCNVRETGKVNSDPSWRSRIDEDYNRRRK